MIFIGDIHGKFDLYRRILGLPIYAGLDSFQVGDMGLGFGDANDTNRALQIQTHQLPVDKSTQHKFIRGNHDNPFVCLRYFDRYLGDFGYIKESDMFFVSGGLSIDAHWRTNMYDWWEGEELSSTQMDSALDVYEKCKPSIMVTHECPSVVKAAVMTNGFKTVVSRTEMLLQDMYDIHQPDIWIFGHHHNNVKLKEGNTQFICLDEGGVHNIPEISW